jgi:hypothetical protein
MTNLSQRCSGGGTSYVSWIKREVSFKHQASFGRAGSSIGKVVDKEMLLPALRTPFKLMLCSCVVLDLLSVYCLS